MRDDIKFYIKKRKSDSHKGDYGKILVVAGSYGMTGAALMCGKAALKTGAGLVSFAVPGELFPILQIGLPEATCLPREFEVHVDIHDYDVIALGSGLGLHKSNIPVIKKILNEYRGKLVLDADGLNCIMKYSLYGNLSVCKAQVILTPHMGEARRLLDVEDIKDREKGAFEIAKIFNATVVMKGANSLVVHENEVYKNETGNPGMATGGSGDVLTGVIASMFSQGMDAFESAKIGTYVHGLAGDMAAEAYGELGMTAMDIVEKLPMAISEIYDKE